MFEAVQDHTQGIALNYCKTCRRHLNGALSCPGCGAAGVELASVQDVRSTVTMPRVEPEPGDERRPAVSERVPAAELDYEPSEPLADRSAAEREPETRPARRAGAGSGPVQRVDPALAKAPLETVVDEEGSEAVSPALPATVSSTRAEASAPTSAARLASPAASRAARPALQPASHARADDTSPIPMTEDEPDPAEDHRGRRAPKRRGFGLIVSGGCAGIAVAGFLVFGTGGGGGPAASTTSTATSAHRSAGGTISMPAAPSSSLGDAGLTTSASASASVSPSASKSPSHAPSSSPAAPSTSSAPSVSVSPTQTHTKSSPTSTATGCFLFICG